MSNFKVYKLHFTAPLHIGNKRDDQGLSLKTIQSDTLMASVMSVLAKVGTTIPDNGDLGFVVSSLFPYYQKSEDSPAIFFLPMPLQCRLPNLTDVGNAKMVKRIRWTDSGIYSRILAGENLFDGKSEYFDYIHGEYLSTSNIPDKFIFSEVCQRVNVESRIGGIDALPFYVDRITFADHAGFYFLATGDTSLLDTGMSLLSHEGIGTDRNIGYGYFDYNTEQMTISTPTNTDHAVSLSLLIPSSKDQLGALLNSDDIAYEIVRRSGWITTQPYQRMRKNAIYAFLPGSVLGLPNTDICGTIVDLAPDIVRKING